MYISDDAFKAHIYDLICGNFDLEEYLIPESDIVKNEFADGGVCAEAYAEMLEAYSRLCVRLGVEEWNDADVEMIINSLMEIGKRLSFKMFDYGAFYARREL